MQHMKVIYIAGKFRGPTAWDVEQNIREAELLGLEVARIGASPLIPHTNTRYFNGTLTEQFWLDATLALLRKCDAVLTVWNWQDSEGARGEVAEATIRKIPVFFDTDSLDRWITDGIMPPLPTGRARAATPYQFDRDPS
jgi:hypothetical protein